MPYGIKAVDEEPHGCPRWIMRVAVVCIAIFGVIVLRMVVGLGTAYAYYRSAQDFDSFVAERVVASEAIESWLMSGELLSEGQPWAVGDAGAANTSIGAIETSVQVTHGAERLLSTTIRFEGLIDNENGARKAFFAPVPDVETRADMHAVIQVGLLEVQQSLGDEPVHGAELIIETLLVAGEGEDVFRVIEIAELPVSIDEDRLAAQALRFLLGLAHPTGELPEEGLMHQARARYRLSWNKHPSGGGNASPSGGEIRTNCGSYSYETKLELRALTFAGLSITESYSKSQNYSWNEKVW